MVTVSVIIPTFNRQYVLPRAIESVLDQTVSDFEILVIDDASTDGTAQIVEQYDDDRVQYYSHSVNRGASAARNTGISKAQGEYIAFLDSDDEWRPRKLEKQLAYISSGNWTAVYCGFERNKSGLDRLMAVMVNAFRSDSSIYGKEGGKELIEDLLLMQLPVAAGSTLLVEQDTVNEVEGFDEQFPMHQDWEFLIRILQAGELGCVNSDLVLINESGNPSSEKIARAKELYLRKFGDLIENSEKSDDIKNIHSLDAIRQYLRNGDFRKGVRQLANVRIEHRRQYLVLLWAMAVGLQTRLVG